MRNISLRNILFFFSKFHVYLHFPSKIKNSINENSGVPWILFWSRAQLGTSFDFEFSFKIKNWTLRKWEIFSRRLQRLKNVLDLLQCWVYRRGLDFQLLLLIFAKVIFSHRKINHAIKNILPRRKKSTKIWLRWMKICLRYSLKTSKTFSVSKRWKMRPSLTYY